MCSVRSSHASRDGTPTPSVTWRRLYASTGPPATRNAWDSIAFAHARLGNHDDAIAHYERAAELHTALGHRLHLATTLVRLGDTHHDAGQVEPAVRVWRQAMTILSELGHPDAAAVRDRLERLSPT